MNQDSSINNIRTAQNVTQAITNREVPPISNDNTKSKSDIKNESNTICSESMKQSKNPKFKRKSVIILGHKKMIKRTNRWEIVKKLKPECKVFERIFSRETTQCMADYMKPSIRAKANHFILHVGTNDLNSKRTPDEIAKISIDLASELKSEKSHVSIS